LAGTAVATAQDTSALIYQLAKPPESSGYTSSRLAPQSAVKDWLRLGPARNKALIDALKSPDPVIRRAAISAFMQIGFPRIEESLLWYSATSEGQRIFPFLVEALDDPQSEVRSEAYRAISLLIGGWDGAAAINLGAMPGSGRC
jgi:HEAT repeat protein